MEATERTISSRDDDPADCRSGPAITGRSAWPKLGQLDRAVVGLTMALLAVVTIPRLPPGICYGDSGGLQLASATLGITHPPGYAGYASLGYVATLMPGVDPARMVSLACLAAGLGTILLGIMLQVKLGLSAAAACAVGLALTAHPRVWMNLLAPEVYVPSLAFEAGAAYLLIKYSRAGGRRYLLLAALLFGVALANRPPVGLALPFFLVGWWLAHRGREVPWRQSIDSLILVVGLATLPSVYSLGYLWVRDNPRTPFNYIEQYNAEFRELPDAQEGPRAKFERVLWHATGRQFGHYLGNTWPGVRSRMRWLCNNILPDHPIALTMAAVLVLLGATLAYRRCAVSTWLLAGMGLGSVGFIGMYRVYGDAADFIPLLLSSAVFAGVALSALFPATGTPGRRVAAGVVLAIAGTFTIIDAPGRPRAGRWADATPFLARVDLGTLPRNSVICSGWSTSTPLWYARHVLHQRQDIDVVNATPGHWRRVAAEASGRPVFTTHDPGSWSGYTAAPYRSLWRLEAAVP